MREYALYKDIVKATDPSTGESVIGRIGCTVRSTWLGIGDDPDWVYIIDTWYRDNEVELATTQEMHDYQSAEAVSDNEAGNLVDGNITINRFGGSISDDADVVAEHD